jgi:hypothetical protein
MGSDNSDKLFFHKGKKDKYKKDCRHATHTECEKKRCWYAEHLTYRCLHALHRKDKHASCKGEYLVGYTGKNGAALYLECECLCHQDKYYSPLSGRWV